MVSIITIIVSLAVFAYLFFTLETSFKNESTAQETKENIGNKFTTNETKEVETSDWKTYRNEKYGFEFKYPPQYFINLPLTLNKETGYFEVSPQQEALNSGLKYASIATKDEFHVNFIEIQSLPLLPTRAKNDPLQDTTQTDLISQRAEIENSKAFKGSYVSENKSSMSKIIKIGDRKLKRSIWYSHQSGSFINTVEFFSKNGDLITMESYITNAKTIEEAKNDHQTNIFDTIISTFKFTE